MNRTSKAAAAAAISTWATIALAAAASAQEAGQQQQMRAQQGSAVSEEDRKFIITAASGGIAEVEMANLALQKSKDPDVKQHAQHMIDDHTKANDELKQIASAKGVTIPSEPQGKHKEAVEKLSSLEGEEFDRQYMQEAGLKAHREMQGLFRTQVNRGQDPQVKQFASKTLPVVEQHLEHSQKMASEKKQ